MIQVIVQSNLAELYSHPTVPWLIGVPTARWLQPRAN